MNKLYKVVVAFPEWARANEDIRREGLMQLALNFGGATCYDASGSYVGEGGRVLLEETLVFEVVAMDSRSNYARIQKFCDWLKSELVQDCVLLVVQDCQGRLT